MRILIFGASGATGHNLVLQAIKQRHEVTAFVRSTSRLRVRHEALSIFQGDVLNYQPVEDAIEGHDAVLCALGAAHPFKRDLVLIKGIRNITLSMMKLSVKRFIYLSFLGADEDREELGFVMNILTPLILKNIIKDHLEKEKIITKSELDWIIVRPPKLTNGVFTGKYRDGEHIKPRSFFPTISRADVADFMLKQLTSQQYVHRTPRIMH
ncbi:MAG: NAD(P)-dependent oxidoreductase [Bacteroidota bacterium]